MSRGSAAKLISACCGLIGFAVAIVAGLATGVEAGGILSRALIALLICYFVGLMVGAVGQRAVAEALQGLHTEGDSLTSDNTSGAGAAPVETAA